MKSSTGIYYIALDHIRAVAAFLVFFWHFNNINNGHLEPPLFFPVSLFTEGHAGVAVFMTLSGYLFAKILDGKEINFARFIWNRCVRLLPLLVLVMAFVAFRRYVKGDGLEVYLSQLKNGFIYPTWPQGMWSIAIEFHFYLALPIIFWMKRQSNAWLFVALLAAIFVRSIIFYKFGSIQELAYWTIVGRFDQFLLGIIAYSYRDFFKGSHLIVFAIFIGFLVYYHWFDLQGGFSAFGGYPSTSSTWVILTTVQGAAFASVTAWCDMSFKSPSGVVSSFIAKIGEYSYSIYLLHFFFVANWAAFVNQYIVHLGNPIVNLFFALIGFLMMVPVGYLSYRFIESPFLRYRVKYIRNAEPAKVALA